MGARSPLLIPLNDAAGCTERIAGGKASTLAALAREGFTVPAGFVLTTRAYQAFLDETEITAAIRMELGRKPMDEMRWEEIWDTALRIRSLFLAHPLPPRLSETLAEGMGTLDKALPLAVRSSAVGEDSAGRSFAGLHESVIGIRDRHAAEDAVRLVWASLWSDAALLYRKELGLDPLSSRMAVVIQEMVEADRSGVAFARDPRDMRKPLAIIETVPGPCRLLVDGAVDPDRWEIDRETRRIIAWLPGEREHDGSEDPLLDPADLETILETLLSIEDAFGWAPDMEWTGRAGSLTVLQARPVTSEITKEDTERAWYLTLRPGDARLKKLRRRVAELLIPKLESAGKTLAGEDLDALDDSRLAAAIEHRREAVNKWKAIYRDEFIPFAHGVRRLAIYYNDAVKPDDPYEFVGLLRDQPLLAVRRNRAIGELARHLAADDALRQALGELLVPDSVMLSLEVLRDELGAVSDGAGAFLDAFDELVERFFDIAYDAERLGDRPATMLNTIVELSKRPPSPAVDPSASERSFLNLERRLIDAVGPSRRVEALEIIETGRVSWKLRDDDNLLVARLESQLLRALDGAAGRLRATDRLSGAGRVTAVHARKLIRLLRDPSSPPVALEEGERSARSERPAQAPGETPRQLIGQPASPGVAAGLVRRIRGRDDLGSFRQGEILVCDAIQPTMTHLVPLAAAIVERRGGMLIHGAIIARELGIPCVNGVRGAADVLRDGDLVTVDGHLGIVTVGQAEFDLELGEAAESPRGT